jgi:protein JSN1
MDSLLQQQQQQAAALAPFLNELSMLNKNSNRFRSWSVNAKEKLAEDEDDQYVGPYSGIPSGTLTPSAASAAAALAATQAQIHQHNLAVQAFANHASASRPRARTAGVLDTPPQRSMRSYLTTPSRLDSSITAADLRLVESGEYDGLVEAVQSMQLGGLIVPGLDFIDDNNLEGPTRALWIGSIPVSTTVSSLEVIFKVYGKIESTRVLTHKNCGFVNFEKIEAAIQAKSLLNGKEIFPGAGPVRIGYAKVPNPSTNGTPGANGVQPSPTPDIGDGTKSGSNDKAGTANGADASHQVNGIHAETAAPALQMPELADLRHEMVQIAGEFGASGDESLTIANTIESAISFDAFEGEIPPVPEPSQIREHDAPKLRDIRKRIDNNACSQADIEQIALNMLPEIAELSSDYLGNTVVQKLFEYCSEEVKDCMLEKIAPTLAEIGVHKNGTWAAQKIIDVAKTPHQMATIVEALRPYTVSLFLDQYGNYVLQCCLRFGSPFNNFIFETMLSKMWEVSQGRFGARAMRACLESHHAAKYQQRMLASAIALHSVQLAMNTNGALLLTWFLDTCTFPNRRSVLAPRLEPHFVHLCTHKLAYLTVLKVINQRNEPEAREKVLKALFFSQGDTILENILSDQNCGSTFVFKVLTTPYFDESLRADVVQNVRNVLSRIKASPNQGYKRLMDEVGLSSRTGGSSRDSHHNRDATNSHASNVDRQRPISQPAAPMNSYIPQSNMERQYSGQYVPNIHTPQFDPQGGISRSSSTDPANYSPYDQFNPPGLNGTVFPQTPISPVNQQQLQYQAYLNSAGRSAQNNAFYPGMAPNGYGTYPTPSPSLDNYRNVQGHGSPLAGPISQMSQSPMLGHSQFNQQQFSPSMGGQLYSYAQNPQGFFSQQQQQQTMQAQQQVGGRRGRAREPRYNGVPY